MVRVNVKSGGGVEVNVRYGDTTPAKWKGAWNPDEAYAPLEKVSHLGSSYICTHSHVGVDPEADVALGDGTQGQHWILIAKKGDPFEYSDFTEEQLEMLVGPSGPTGPTGPAFEYSDFTPEQLEKLKGPPGPTGKSGVYVGSGTMPEGYNVQVDPDGDGFDLGAFIEEELQKAKDSGEFDGPQGIQGHQGETGPQGYSPQVTVTKISNGSRVEITSYDEKTGATKRDLFDLKDGQMGTQGPTGPKGDSCNVQATETEEGVQLYITNTTYNASGSASQDVQMAFIKHGKDGEDGEGGADVFIATYGVTTHAEILAAQNAGKPCFCTQSSGTGLLPVALVNSNTARFVGAFTQSVVIVVTVSKNDVWSQTTQALVKSTGDTMTGALTLAADPVEAMQAATKQYVDSKLEENVELLGKEVKWADVTEKPFDKNNVLSPESLPNISWNDLEDKPFGVVSEGALLADVEGAAFTFQPPSFYAYSCSISGNPIVVGKKYSVVWNGVEYNNLLAFSDDYGYATIGAKGQPDNSMPFAVVQENETTLFVATYAKGTYSFKITEQGEVKTIDPVYLPEIIPTVTTSDNGKFLRVVNGAWAAVALESAEGGSF